MRTLLRLTALPLLAAVAAAGSTAAHACACCGEPGTRSEITIALDEDSFQGEVVRSVRLAGQARLYLDAADWEVVRGVDNPDRSDRYAVGLQRDRTEWTFTFRDGAGNAGTIALALPSTFESFHADTRPGEVQKVEAIQVYKEYRLTGRMTGTGMFAIKPSAQAETQATLILHGHGNQCPSVDQFHHWTLEARGPETRFRFYGPLAKP